MQTNQTPGRLAGQASPAPASNKAAYIQWFQEIGIDDIPLVGGKNASLGEMCRELASQGVKVPDGFAVTAEAYRHFLREGRLDDRIRDILQGLDTGDMENLSQRGSQVRHAIMGAELPQDLVAEILAAYDALRGRSLHPVSVAVRSSATAEDLPDASFAGQQETYLNVQGHLGVLHACKSCFPSLFTDRAISYRTDKGFDHQRIALSMGIQRMVRSDLGAAGVMFTVDTETGFREVVLINASYGLGENVVQGSVNPDEFFVFKPTLKQGFKPILQKILGSKEFKLVYEKMENGETKAAIHDLTIGYADKAQFFVDKLAQGVAMIAAAFHPKDVILRLSDFKTNEYANLIGGRHYEPAEENPMIGFRGASRYYNPRYQAGFALECRAMKKVRAEMRLKNLKLMIPFCRTVQEARLVQAEMEKHGLKRGEDGLEVYVMCEIPSNVILAEEFAEVFDGFSIGSNDLTQLILGVDRDSEIVAHIFDERNAAVKAMIAQVIQVCRAKGRKIGICGQAPSDYPDFAQFLVERGIDSISLNPDTVMKTTVAILERENELKQKE